MNGKIGNLELNKIYCMDCVDGMKELPDNSIDLCITDPPYGIGKEFEKGLDLKELIKTSYNLLYKKMKEDSWFVYTCPTNKIDFFIEYTKNAGFKYERCFFYYKKSKMTDVWMGWLLKSEAILLFSKGNPNRSNSGKEKYNHDVYTITIPNRKQSNFINHQCAKSEEVWRHLIMTLSNKDDTVIDIFNGGGTTSMVCKQLNRNYICFEINEEYCKIANKRLEQGVLNL